MASKTSSTDDDFWDKIGKKKLSKRGLINNKYSDTALSAANNLNQQVDSNVMNDLQKQSSDNSNCIDEVDIAFLISSGDYIHGHLVQLDSDELNLTTEAAFSTVIYELDGLGARIDTDTDDEATKQKEIDFVDACVASMLQKRKSSASRGHTANDKMLGNGQESKTRYTNGNHERCDGTPFAELLEIVREDVSEATSFATEATATKGLSTCSYQNIGNMRADKFDTACSHTMSGDSSRVANAKKKVTANGISIRGFNSSSESASVIFENEDGFRELYVSSMPEDLLLISAQHYVKHFGGSFLHEDGGILFRYKYAGGKEELEKWFEQNVEVVGDLKTINSTYELKLNENAKRPAQVTSAAESTYNTAYSVMCTTESELEWQLESAYSATKFFNNITQVSNDQERVIAMLMSGLSMKDLHSMVENNSVDGLEKRITKESLNSVSKNFGTTLSHKQLALPYQARKGKGYFAEPEKLTFCGQLVEMDYADALWNYTDEKGITRKLPTSGGGVCMFTCVDAYSGFAFGGLGKNKKDSLAWVMLCWEFFERIKHPIQAISADQNINIRSNHQVIVPAVDKFMSANKIRKVGVENYSHNNGGAHIERFFRTEHELQLYAVIHILLHPQFEQLGFTKLQIKSLWGELYHWAKFISNLKECPNYPGKTKWEVFFGYKCDLKRYRLLPILCCCLVLRRTPNELGINRTFWQRALYCGPDMEVNGAIRAAVVEKGVIKIVVTSTIKSVSEGLGPDLHKIADRHVQSINSEESEPETTPSGVDRSAISRIKSNTVQPTHLDLGGEMQHNEVSNSDNNSASAANEDVEVTNDNVEGSDEEYVDNTAENSNVDSKVRKKQRSANDNHYNRRLRAKQRKQQLKKEGQQLKKQEELKLLMENDLKVQVQLKEEQHKAELLKQRQEEELRQKNEAIALKREVEAMRRLDRNGPLALRDVNFYQDMLARKGTRAERAARRELHRSTAYHVLYDGINAVSPAAIDAFVTSVTSITGEELKGSDYQDANEDEWLKSLREQHHIAMVGHYHEAYDAQWTQYEEDGYYYSFTAQSYIAIVDIDKMIDAVVIDSEWHEAMRSAVTEGTPKNFQIALRDPEWGEPARKEYNKLVYDTTSAIPVPRELAMQNIRKGADLLMFIPIYEIKTDELTGKDVKAVRLVLNGSQQKNYGSTFAATPSREELFVMMHVAAKEGLDIVHVDEKRAFLTADKSLSASGLPTYGRFQGIAEIYHINKAIYGQRDAMRDYLEKRDGIMRSIGFERLTMCTSMYKKRVDGKMILVYVHVDDFVFAGDRELVLSQIIELRKVSSTTEPVVNPANVLGIGMNRDEDCKERCVIELNMADKIVELHAKCKNTLENSSNDKLKGWDKALDRKSNIPMPMEGYIVEKHKLEELGELALPLPEKEISDYLQVVGSLIWIAGVRFDICFALMYLTWNSKAPCYHHLKMAYRVVSYLFHNKDLPLCLGGKSPIEVIGYSDASLATGPNARSIVGDLIKLGEDAGAIKAKNKALPGVSLSSFEAELEALFRSMKSIREIQNILDDMEVERVKPSRGFTDNKAMQQFVKSDGVTKGVKHMEMRLWALRLEYLKGDIRFEHMPGVDIPSDLLTKLGPISKHWKYVKDILGLGLMGDKWMRDKDLLKEMVEEESK